MSAPVAQSGAAVTATSAPAELEERRALAVASGAHALHDGYTDVIYVLLPLWQAEFGIGYAALGVLRTCFSGTMAGLQIPSALLSERIGLRLVLAGGTALSGVGYLIAGSSVGYWTLVAALLIGGVGSSTQHPLASAMVARTFAGQRAMKALGTYNFAGDIGKMAMPAAASLMLVLMPWQPVMVLLGICGLVGAVAIFRFAPRLSSDEVPTLKDSGEISAATRGSRAGFSVLLTIGMIDSATRMGFLIFLPFILVAKGASLPFVGLALSLVFAGGAVGKLVCGFIGARVGITTTVCLTEGLTAAGIVLLQPLPLVGALILLPLIGMMLNGTSSVLYGSVPSLVAPEKRTRMFGVFYTGTIGSGAIAPAFYGLVGDATSVPMALNLVALICLLTLPLALVLRPMLPPSPH